MPDWMIYGLLALPCIGGMIVYILRSRHDRTKREERDTEHESHVASRDNGA